MSNLERGYVQLPPDSTGKKSGSASRLIIEFTGETAPNLFEPGQTVVGGTSSATALVVGKFTEGFAAGEGQLFLELESLVGTFQVSENLNVSAVTFGVFKAGTTTESLYYQKHTVVDRDYPSRSWCINSDGAGTVEFPDGPPAISSFGGQVSEEVHSIRQYVYPYDETAGEFWTESGVSGVVSYGSDSRSVTLDTSATDAGSFIRRTSHYYHPQQPGTMNRATLGVRVGDAGKSNVRRRWGVFDANDGWFWELDDTTLYVVQRSSAAGSGGLDTRVVQGSWSHDDLDGSERMNLDLTKNNMYFIDYADLGAGVVRFGVHEEDGLRTLAHCFENSNTLSAVATQKATLPLRFECENTSTAASSSELISNGAIIQHIGTPKRQAVTQSVQSSQVKTVTQASGEIPIMSFQAATGVLGLTNRTTTVLSEISAANVGTGPVILRVRYAGVLDGASFTSVADRSSSEWDEAASGITVGSNFGLLRWSDLAGNTETLKHSFVQDKEIFQDTIGVVLLADGVTQAPISITAESVDASHTGQLVMTATWKEMWV